MMYLSTSFPIVILTLTTACLASPISTTNVHIASDVNSEEYVPVFGRDLVGTYCGTQLTDLVGTIRTDIDTIISSFDQIISDVNSAISCSCKLETDVTDNIAAVYGLIKGLIGNIVLIKWDCITITLCISIGNSVCTLLGSMVAFLECILKYAVEVNLEIDAEIWQIIIGIPSVFSGCLTEICGAVSVFKLIVWSLLLDLQVASQSLVPYCGCNI